MLVGVISVVSYYSAFSPSLRGSLDEAGPEWITGWVLDFSNTDARVEVQLYIDGRFQESKVADFPHPNLVTLGLAPDDKHGFFSTTPPLEVGANAAGCTPTPQKRGGERRTLQQLGKSLTFQTSGGSGGALFQRLVDAADQL